jgi:hypothetical protein
MGLGKKRGGKGGWEFFRFCQSARGKTAWKVLFTNQCGQPPSSHKAKYEHFLKFRNTHFSQFEASGMGFPVNHHTIMDML